MLAWTHAQVPAPPAQAASHCRPGQEGAHEYARQEGPGCAARPRHCVPVGPGPNWLQRVRLVTTSTTFHLHGCCRRGIACIVTMACVEDTLMATLVDWFWPPLWDQLFQGPSTSFAPPPVSICCPWAAWAVSLCHTEELLVSQTAPWAHGRVSSFCWIWGWLLTVPVRTEGSSEGHDQRSKEETKHGIRHCEGGAYHVWFMVCML